MKKYSFDAVIFDLDGVITHTASVHSAAWKQMFDEFLKAHSAKTGAAFHEFSHIDDYLPYVDGKPRYKGVQSFLESRDIDLPHGAPNDTPAQETICGLGNRKDKLFNESIARGNVKVFSTTVDFIKELVDKNIKVGVASSSKNCKTVLEATGLEDIFETRVDGVVSAELNLKGKPEPDIFTTACDNLGVRYDRSVIVEDAVSGVQAGLNGNFGLVLGIARENNEQELKQNGADIVVQDLGEIDFERVEKWFTTDLKKDQWSLNYNNYAPENEGTREALCTIGNGYFGTRGALEEAVANNTNYPGTYIAGVYNRLESEVAGRIIVNEDFVNCPNWLSITFKIGDGEWLDLNKSEIISFTRRLDFRTGVFYRKIILRDKTGRETLIESSRFASMADPHLAALQYKITPLNYSEYISIKSGLNGRIINGGVERYKQLSSKHLKPLGEDGHENTSYILLQTNQSLIKIAEAAKILVFVNDEKINPDFVTNKTSGAVSTTFNVKAEKNHSIGVEKLVTIYTSNDKNVDNPLQAAQKDLLKVNSFDEILQTSNAAWADIWDKIDIQIEGDRLAQKLLRLHLYHTIITVSPNNTNIDAGIPARGLHGEAYRGHIFWDELFILPVYNMHFPETAKSVLLYRSRRLDQAKLYANEYGYKGAMYPWQSGSDGSEETQVIHLNPLSGEWGTDHSSLQRHVSLAIAYNIWQYYWITDDYAFIKSSGAEMFLEICRFWDSKADYDEKTDRYEIEKVMGPDEYHEKYPDSESGGLKDNSYTNIMVVWTFNKAFKILDSLSDQDRKEIMGKIKLTDVELERWRAITKKIHFSISEEGVLEQYEGYFDLKELNWDFYKKKFQNISRMDRILKAEGKSPDEFKVSKQADVLMTFYNINPGEVIEILNNAGYSVNNDLLRFNFDYYLKRTSHGSTLSKLVHSYLANIINNTKLSWQFYSEALKSDYPDIQGGTTKEGIHTGVMAGTVVLALKSYAGLNLDDNNIRIDPCLPAVWRRIEFNVGFRGNRYYFKVTPESVSVKVDSEEKIDIYIQDRKLTLKPLQWENYKSEPSGLS